MAKKSGGVTAAFPDNDWQAEDDMRTLCRAEEIKKDPKRYAKAKKKAIEKMQELQDVATETSDAD